MKLYYIKLPKETKTADGISLHPWVMLTFSQTLVKSTFCNVSRLKLLACCPNTTRTRQGGGFVFKKFLLVFFCHEKCKWQHEENYRVTLRFIGHFKKVHRDTHAVCYLTKERWKNNRQRLSAERLEKIWHFPSKLQRPQTGFHWTQTGWFNWAVHSRWVFFHVQMLDKFCFIHRFL